MMNKFLVFPCVKQNNENGYEGSVVTLACATNMSFVLFFPVSDENAQMINYILEKNPEEYTSDLNVVGIYKTMIDSWEAGGRFLSGISLDLEFVIEEESEAISIKLILSSEEDGAVDSVIKVNFIHAILLAAMERKEILVSNELLNKLMPEDIVEGGEEEGENDDDSDDNDDDNHPLRPEDSKNFPIDKDILDIAKKIMSGKI